MSHPPLMGDLGWTLLETFSPASAGFSFKWPDLDLRVAGVRPVPAAVMNTSQCSGCATPRWIARSLISRVAPVAPCNNVQQRETPRVGKVKARICWKIEAGMACLVG